MEEQIISFETAKLLKEIGIEEGLNCNYVYCIGYETVDPEEEPIKCESVRNSVKGQFHLALAPTQSLAQKYLREKYNLYAIALYKGYNEWGFQVNEINNESRAVMVVVLGEEIFNSHEEALDKGLQELCKYIDENSITNSPVGSNHWFNTILSQIKHIGEYLSEGGYVEARTLRSWGNKYIKVQIV